VHRGVATADPTITSVVNKLLSSLFELARRSMESAIWMGVARCLGELGAIDPARVNVTIRVEQVCVCASCSSGGKVGGPVPPHWLVPERLSLFCVCPCGIMRGSALPLHGSALVRRPRRGGPPPAAVE
jgi:hypothetical protein